MPVVKMYTTQSCGYCMRAKALLKQRGVTELDEVRVDLNPAERDTMVQITGRRTVPTARAACCPCWRRQRPKPLGDNRRRRTGAPSAPIPTKS
jgi:glutaredoxin